ncbi:transposase family protein, partial [Desulfovibrio desulfuricans]|uniref:transposase family protein n=1 Tax=Desulfovibrio desulfuricans TaxID=876 RepID=UPI0023B06DE6
MESNDLLTLGLGLTAPWRVVYQSLDLSKQPSELRLEVEAARGERYPCPACGALCKAHHFAEFSWRLLNFFQHHWLIKARVPRVRCPEHGLKRV